jgi:ketosteroid isomerase-like protein
VRGLREEIEAAHVGNRVRTPDPGEVARETFAMKRVWAQRDGRWRITHSFLDIRPPEGAATASLAGVEREVAAAAEAYFDAARAIDEDRIMAFFPDDPLIFLANRIDYSSRDTIHALIRSGVATLRSWEGSWRDTRVIPLAPDAAVFFGIADIRQTTLAGEVTEFPDIHVTIVFHRTDGAWKMRSFHQSFEPPS